MADIKVKETTMSSGNMVAERTFSDTREQRPNDALAEAPPAEDHPAKTDLEPEAVGKAFLSTNRQLNERQEMIRIISNRLFVALLLMLGAFIIGGLLTWKGILSVGATNWMVLLCGAIGGFISVQRRLKNLDPDDLLLLARSWVYVLLSPLVGGILASLLFFLFISGLLDGDLFPEFSTNPAQSETNIGLLSLFSVYGKEYSDYAKIIFWCFLAGYSESFVTNIISQFESGTEQSGKKT